MKSFLLISLLLMMTACETFDNIEWVQKKPDQVITSLPNQTNETINETEEVVMIENLTDGTYYFVAKDTVVIINNKTSVVLDAGEHTATQLLKDMDLQPNLLVITLDKPEKTNGVKYLVLKTKPKIIMDNGLDTSVRKEYLKYADKLGVTSGKVIRDKTLAMPGIDVSFFVPFSKNGFFREKDMNSIVVKANNLLYMSNCYGRCERMVNVPDVKYIVLANNGNCPTNSLEFVLDMGADTIIGENLCNDFLQLGFLDNLEELEFLGIEFIQMDGMVSLHE